MKIETTFEEIAAFQNLFYPGWMNEMEKTMLSSALAAETGEVCGVVTHLEGGGTNNRKYNPQQVLHQCVDVYVQTILLLKRYGFTAKDFIAEFQHVIEVELPQRLEAKTEMNKSRV